MNRFLAASATLAMLTAGAGDAAAAGFGPSAPGAASSSAECTVDSTDVSSAAGCLLIHASARVRTSPFVLLDANAGGDPGTSANAIASLDYDFQVMGGAAGDPVTIGMTISMLTSLTAGGSAFAQIDWDDADASGDRSVCASSDPAATACVGNSAFNGVLSFAGEVGDVGHIHLGVVAGNGLGGTGSAQIDPQMFVQFDPDHLHSILLSDGISNALPGATGAPEPATWALMLGGLGLTGAALRRRAGPAHA